MRCGPPAGGPETALSFEIRFGLGFAYSPSAHSQTRRTASVTDVTFAEFMKSIGEVNQAQFYEYAQESRQ